MSQRIVSLMSDLYAQFFTISVKRLPSAFRVYLIFWDRNDCGTKVPVEKKEKFTNDYCAGLKNDSDSRTLDGFCARIVHSI